MGKYTVEEKEVMFKKIEELKAGGASVKDACKAAGMDINLYYWWSKRRKAIDAVSGRPGPKKKPSLEEQLKDPISIPLLSSPEEPSSGKKVVLELTDKQASSLIKWALDQLAEKDAE